MSEFGSLSDRRLATVAMALEVAYKETGIGVHDPGVFLAVADEYRRRGLEMPNPYGTGMESMTKGPDDWMRGFQAYAVEGTGGKA